MSVQCSISSNSVGFCNFLKIVVVAAASKVFCFLSRISYLSSSSLARDCCRFTSKKLFVCLETFLRFLRQFDRAFVSRARYLGFIHPLFALTPNQSNVAAYAQAC